MDDNKPRSGRRVRIALGLSVALNLLVLGLVAGAILAGGPNGHDRGKLKDRRNTNAAIGIYGHALEKSDRRAIGQRMRAERDSEGENIRTQLGEMTREAAVVLKHEPFDEGAFLKLLQDQQGVIKGRSDQMQEVLVEHLGAMSSQQRQDYAARLHEILERGPRR